MSPNPVQYHPAGSGYGVSSPQGEPQSLAPGGQAPQKPSGRRRAAVVAMSLALVVALVATAGAVYLVLRGDPVKDVTLAYTASPEVYSQDWVWGAEEAWRLEAPEIDKDEQDIWVDIAGDYLIREVTGTGTTYVTVYSLKHGQPEELWRDQVPTDSLRVAVWSSQVVVGNTLIDLETQKRQTASWSADAKAFVTSKGVLACDASNCSLWTSLTNMAWQTDKSVGSNAVVSREEVDGHVFVWNFNEKDPNEGETFFLDLETGALVDYMKEGPTLPLPLADGWYTVRGSNLDPTRIVFYNPDGSLREEVSPFTEEGFTTYPWSPSRFTLEQARKWVKDGDVSWAPSTYEVSQKDPSCQSITVAGKEVFLGENTSRLTEKSDDGRCLGMRVETPMRFAGSGKVLRFTDRDKYATEAFFVDMATGTTSERLNLPKLHKDVLRQGTLLVVFQTGEVAGYRPAGKR